MHKANGYGHEMCNMIALQMLKPVCLSKLELTSDKHQSNRTTANSQHFSTESHKGQPFYLKCAMPKVRQHVLWTCKQPAAKLQLQETKPRTSSLHCPIGLQVALDNKRHCCVHFSVTHEFILNQPELCNLHDIHCCDNTMGLPLMVQRHTSTCKRR
jgi:hypothetical protein